MAYKDFPLKKNFYEFSNPVIFLDAGKHRQLRQYESISYDSNNATFTIFIIELSIYYRHINHPGSYYNRYSEEHNALEHEIAWQFHYYHRPHNHASGPNASYAKPCRENINDEAQSDKGRSYQKRKRV
jgi:hypothetical protein